MRRNQISEDPREDHIQAVSQFKIIDPIHTVMLTKVSI